MKEHSSNQKKTGSRANANQSFFQKKFGKEPFFKPKGNDSGFFKNRVPFFSTPVQRKRNNNLPEKLQANMESSLGQDYSNINIQKNSQEAVNLGARAFTKGDSIHFAPGEFNLNSEQGRNLIGHEFTHVAQQRSGVVKPTSVMGKGLSMNDDKGLENEADIFGKKAVKGELISKYQSSSLKTRNNDVIQRDIKGTGKVTHGEFKIDMEKKEIPPESKAGVEGTIKFTPNEKSPNTNEIGLIQIVRDIDLTKSPPEDYKWTGGEADRNKMMTSENVRTYKTKENDSLEKISKEQTKYHVTTWEIYQLNKTSLGTFDKAKAIPKDTELKIPIIQKGYFIDHLAADTYATPRTNKSDKDVSPYYNMPKSNTTNNHDGHKKK